MSVRRPGRGWLRSAAVFGTLLATTGLPLPPPLSLPVAGGEPAGRAGAARRPGPAGAGPGPARAADPAARAGHGPGGSAPGRGRARRAHRAAAPATAAAGTAGRRQGAAAVPGLRRAGQRLVAAG